MGDAAVDFLDIPRMEGDSGDDRVAATITRPEYQETSPPSERAAFAGPPGRWGGSL